MDEELTIVPSTSNDEIGWWHQGRFRLSGAMPEKRGLTCKAREGI
ncbi:MAG: hypothetical protein OJF47_001341 [Nitrospira sp.]|nr:MAG: hypothetical protein OJF47_001341 [Nitrospira sp.]